MKIVRTKNGGEKRRDIITPNYMKDAEELTSHSETTCKWSAENLRSKVVCKLISRSIFTSAIKIFVKSRQQRRSVVAAVDVTEPSLSEQSAIHGV